MTDESLSSVLRRKAGSTSGAAAQPGSLDRMLHLAVSKAADGCHKMPALVTGLAVARVRLDDLLADLPQDGLFLTLEAAGRGLGLAILDLGLIAGLIEMQTMGVVTDAPVEDRPSTRTDARMVEPFLNTTLSIFAEDAAKTDAAGWLAAAKMGFRLEGRRVVGLVLQDGWFHSFTVTVDMGGGAKQGTMHLFLSEPPVVAPGNGAASWRDGLETHVMASPVELNAVLHRLSLPLSKASGLSVGDMVPVPLGAIASIAIEGGDENAVGRGRLGQVNGMRALRLTDNVALPDGGPLVSDQPAPGHPDMEVAPPPSLPISTEVSPMADIPPLGDLPEIELPSGEEPLPDISLGDLMIAQANEEQPV